MRLKSRASRLSDVVAEKRCLQRRFYEAATMKASRNRRALPLQEIPASLFYACKNAPCRFRKCLYNPKIDSKIPHPHIQFKFTISDQLVYLSILVCRAELGGSSDIIFIELRAEMIYCD